MRRVKINFFIKIVFVLVILIVLLQLLYIYTSIHTRSYIYNDLKKIPYNKTAIVLGTSKYTKNKSPNPYFYKRIAAAEILYRSGKVRYLIVSGDNRHRSYNEPMMMKNELKRRGIPDSVIFLDYAGLRTFDSVIRGYKIFGQRSFTVISQRFQVERAIFIAHKYGIGAIGFEADDVDFSGHIFTHIREYFARILMYWDIFTHNQPRYLGAKEYIP